MEIQRKTSRVKEVLFDGGNDEGVTQKVVTQESLQLPHESQRSVSPPFLPYTRTKRLGGGVDYGQESLKRSKLKIMKLLLRQRVKLRMKQGRTRGEGRTKGGNGVRDFSPRWGGQAGNGDWSLRQSFFDSLPPLPFSFLCTLPCFFFSLGDERRDDRARTHEMIENWWECFVE